MNKKKLVVKDNALIDASFNLSLVEQRVMLLAIVEAREINELSPMTPIEIPIQSYIDLYGVSGSTAYESLWEAVKTLKRREFSYLDRYKGEDALSIAGWVNKATYVKKRGLIVIYLSEEVISMISRLESQFTRYHLEQVADFKSKYSIRLYELVIKWLAIGKTDYYEIQDFRAKLGLSANEYKTMSLFKTNVLDKAVDEISTKTDIKIKYEQKRTGRSISHIMFSIKQKYTEIEVSHPVHYTFKLSDKQINMFASLLASDASFGSRVGKVGEQVEDLRKRLITQLADSEFCRKYSSDLVRLGYAEKPKKLKVPTEV
ncbi:replication initiation protein RepM [Acinetobacter indicus]|uniref:replication initiation protein RepM n=1 Tax=Acinetobacter indicus TaxID=756892 RepID=UPI00209B18AE|nr:replication initiation protein RepM [Acinetobacter indicus]MCO8088233.1 replication initiation protein RepM [Acinetobacter indicus]